MKVIFLKHGKCRDGVKLIAVSEDDVENKTVFNISEKTGIEFIDAKRVVRYEEAPNLTKEEVEKLTLPKLKDYAEQKKIDLGDAEKKPDVLKEVLKALFLED